MTAVLHKKSGVDPVLSMALTSKMQQSSLLSFALSDALLLSKGFNIVLTFLTSFDNTTACNLVPHSIEVAKLDDLVFSCLGLSKESSNGTE